MTAKILLRNSRMKLLLHIQNFLIKFLAWRTLFNIKSQSESQNIELQNYLILIIHFIITFDNKSVSSTQNLIP